MLGLKWPKNGKKKKPAASSLDALLPWKHLDWKRPSSGEDNVGSSISSVRREKKS